MNSVLLCSTSPLKSKALIQFLQDRNTETLTIKTFNCDALGLPPQPVNSALQCAKARLEYAKAKNDQQYDYYISIESGLMNGFHGPNRYFSDVSDECYVIIEYKGILAVGHDIIEIPEEYVDFLPDEIDHKLGHSVTFGELLQKDYPDIDPKNWMKTICNYDRSLMFNKALKRAFDNLVEQQKKITSVINAYKTYPDFPKPGVIFQDIFAVLANNKALQDLCCIMRNRYYLDELDYVVGLESRGFFGVLLAKELGIGFIPIRKAGKLPGKVERVEYGTEYSKDVCEMSVDIPEGSRVLVFDDLIATGGSLKASVTLLNKLKCNVVDCCVLREVVGLREKAKETLGQKYTVLLME